MNLPKLEYIAKITDWLMPDTKDPELAADARRGLSLDGVYEGTSARIRRLVSLAYLRGIRRGAACAWNASRPVVLRGDQGPGPHGLLEQEQRAVQAAAQARAAERLGAVPVVSIADLTREQWEAIGRSQGWLPVVDDPDESGSTGRYTVDTPITFWLSMRSNETAKEQETSTVGQLTDLTAEKLELRSDAEVDRLISEAHREWVDDIVESGWYVGDGERHADDDAE